MCEGRGGVRLVPGLDVRAGQTIAGRYRVEALVGAGASGIVLSARTLHLRKRVALKIFASSTDGQEDLVRRRLAKARLASVLQGEHIARIVEIGVTGEAMPYVATEWLEGATLEAELGARERLTVREAARWVLEACEGLAEAHALGLVHGDLKPQNILLAESKKAPRRHPSADGGAAEVDTRVLKILDFGSTSPLDAIGDQSASAFFGSPAFLAPEQIRGAKVDARADIWALGVLLYNAVSGLLPFEADTVSGALVSVVRDAPALLTEAPYELALLVHQCLDKDPARRPQDVATFAAELAPFAGEDGPRLAERVRATLEKPHEVPPPRDASAAGSMPPLSMPTIPPPVQSEETTKLSRSLVSQPLRSGRRMTTLALLSAAGLIVTASFAHSRSWTFPDFLVGATRAPGETVVARPVAGEPSALPLPQVAEADEPLIAPPDEPLVASLDEPPVASLDEPPVASPDEPPTSFAPTTANPMTPTPLAVTATPLVTASLPVALLAPASTPARYPLPPGLPRSRDALPFPTAPWPSSRK